MGHGKHALPEIPDCGDRVGIENSELRNEN
jgi:hypothetical protein